MRQAGRKLRITGKGRCNITNSAPMREFMQVTYPNGKFLYPAFKSFYSDDLIAFLESKGVSCKLERGGRYFPESEKAGDVADALLAYALDKGVEIVYDAKVRHLLKSGKQITGVRYISEMQMHEISAKNVLIATGGKSYPATGSTGDGYKLAKQAGHSIVEPRPALVPIETEGDVAKRLDGLSLKNVSLSLWIEGKKHSEEFGEMLFTSFGLSGPVALTLSRNVSMVWDGNQSVEMSVDLKPALDDKKLDARLQRDLDANGKKNIGNLFKQWLPMKMIPVFLDLLNMPFDKPVNQVSAKDRKEIRKLMKNFRFRVSGLRSFREAIITAGGVELKEINPKTMGSKIHPNLYFAGEVVDLDAVTGGIIFRLPLVRPGWQQNP